jgi:hypothetical protein
MESTTSAGRLDRNKIADTMRRPVARAPELLAAARHPSGTAQVRTTTSGDPQDCVDQPVDRTSKARRETRRDHSVHGFMQVISNTTRGAFNRFLNVLHALSYHINLLRIGDIAIEDYIARHLYGAPRYHEPKRLGVHEFQMFSQTGADGIIAEIFHRIGRTNSIFVEFGVGNGLENNTAALLLQGWSGVWIEASKRSNKEIRRSLKPLIDEQKLTVLEQFVTRDNIVDLLEDCDLPHDPDLVSIDIDGNDYWVWEALLSRYAPRVIVIEYNALLGPSVPWVMEYDSASARKSIVATSYFGGSLKAMEMLGRRNGYSLVGCDFLGINAFFVRNDLLQDKFCAPYTSENHFEPSRLFLYRRNGQPREIGRFVIPSR